MKKKIVAALLVLLIMVLTCGCGDSGSADLDETENAAKTNAVEKEEEPAAETKVEQINLDNAEGSLVYARHELAQDYNGTDAVRIYFTYTNKSDET